MGGVWPGRGRERDDDWDWDSDADWQRQLTQSVTPAARAYRWRLYLACANWKIGNEIGNTFTALPRRQRLASGSNWQTSRQTHSHSSSTALIGDIAQITQMLSITWRRQANTKITGKKEQPEKEQKMSACLNIKPP